MLRFLKGFFVKPTPPVAASEPVAPYKVETPAVVEVAPELAPIVEQTPAKKAPAKKAPVAKPAVAKKPRAKKPKAE